MPMIVDPLATPPAAPLTTTTLDGKITAWWDEVWGGVFLRVDCHADVPVPRYARVVAVDAAGNERAVRGGAKLLLVGGKGYVFDQEAMIGQTNGWFATTRVGWDTSPSISDGPTTQQANLILPSPLGGPTDPSMWVKSLEDPALSHRYMINDWPADARTMQLDLQAAWGQRNLVGGLGALGGFSGDVAVVLQSDAERKRLESCVASGVLLIQVAPQFLRRDFYAVAQNFSVSDFGKNSMRLETKIATLSLLEVDPPDPDLDDQGYGSVPRRPGHSYLDRLQLFPLYSNVPPRTYLQVAESGV